MFFTPQAIPGVNWAANAIRRLYDWMGTFVHSPYGNWVLALFFFVEAIFFLPTDPLLILFCVERPKKAIFYSLVATVASVAGGITAYYIGFSVWNSIGHQLIALFTTPATFNYLCEQYKLYQNWAVLIGGFTPIPYKAITLTAGFCKLPLIPFIICSFIARGARFFLIGSIMFFWGATVKEYIDRYFNTLVMIFMMLVMLTIWIIK